jgi:hypothetical protein
MTRPRSLTAFIAIPIALLLLSITANATELKTGVNITNAERLTSAQQNEMLIEMRAAGVRIVRANIVDDDKGIQFAQSAKALGIRIDWIVPIHDYIPGAPTRAYQREAYPDMWGGHPLSYADPDQFRLYFIGMLSRLEAAGITLEAFELGNEINWSAFNPEFPLPGKGRQFNLEELSTDPEAKQIAAGYLQYLKVLKVLKDVRDHSKLNRQTPILSAGLAASEKPDGPLWSLKKEDIVSIDATLEFMRAHGLDKLVDAYAIHVYPWSNQPGDPTADAERATRLAKYDLAQCRPAGSTEGKPCWMTEWGFANKSLSCPIKDRDRALLIRSMMSEFRKYADEGRLIGAIYYSWNTDAWEREIDPLTIFRCGALTEGGRLAIAPRP